MVDFMDFRYPKEKIENVFFWVNLDHIYGWFLIIWRVCIRHINYLEILIILCPFIIKRRWWNMKSSDQMIDDLQTWGVLVKYIRHINHFTILMILYYEAFSISKKLETKHSFIRKYDIRGKSLDYINKGFWQIWRAFVTYIN